MYNALNMPIFRVVTMMDVAQAELREMFSSVKVYSKQHAAWSCVTNINKSKSSILKFLPAVFVCHLYVLTYTFYVRLVFRQADEGT